jgi:hypothetical protein
MFAAKARSRPTMCRSGRNSISEIRRNFRYDRAMKSRAAFVMFALLAAMAPAHGAPAHAAATAQKLVYKIDSVIATVRGGHVTIQVKGAVKSGGWKAPRLKLMRSDPHSIVVSFLASPPRPGAPVIQGLMPIGANLVAPMRKGVVSVRAVSDANEMTTQLLK